jgi:4-amino-4-deoxy-L-arabinose transferase-like glycosyltransferase
MFGVAVLIKFALIAAFFWPDGCFSSRSGDLVGSSGYDDVGYFQMARTLADQGMLIYPGHPDQPTVFRTPGYPVFLAALGMVTGWNVFFMQLLQAVVVSLAPLLLLLILRHLKTPLWPAWLLVFDPLTNLMAITFMTEGLLILFLLASLYCFLRAKEHVLYLFAGFLLWSLSILIKPSGQFFYFVILVMLILYRVEWKRAIALALVAFTPVLGWMVRNHQVSGNLCVSTQTDNAIMAKITAMGHGDKAEMKKLTDEYSVQHADEGGLMGLITDNKIDFKDETKAFIRANPLLFIKYHLLGMPRVLFGSGRAHVAAIFYNNEKEPGLFYNAGMMLWYGLLYALVVLLFRFTCLRDLGWWFSFLFCAYNVALIGIFAYTTGGGLKRAPFIPFLIVMIAIELRELLIGRKKKQGEDHGNA